MVAMQEHGRADADGVALHGGDQWLFAVQQHVEKTDDRRADRAVVVRELDEIADVVAGAEIARAAGDEQAAEGRVVPARSRSPRPWRRTSQASARSSCPAGSSARVRTGPSSVTVTRSLIAVTPQRGLRLGDAVGAFGHRALEARPIATAMFSAKKRVRAVRAAPSPVSRAAASACSASMQPPAAWPNMRR